MTKARGLAYLRVSTDEQARSGLGLEAQKRAIMDAARRLNIKLAVARTDAGLSGGLRADDRPGLLYLLGVVRKGDVLLVAKRDRLGRDHVEVGLIERNLAKQGVRVISAAGEGTEGELDDPGAFLQRGMHDVVAGYERLIIKARTKAALRAKKARGERVGGVPFGYSCEDGKLTPNQDERNVIGWILQFQAKGWPVRDIAVELWNRGVKSRKGTPFSKSQVHRLIKRYRRHS